MSNKSCLHSKGHRPKRDRRRHRCHQGAKRQDCQGREGQGRPAQRGGRVHPPHQAVAAAAAKRPRNVRNSHRVFLPYLQLCSSLSLRCRQHKELIFCLFQEY